MKKRQLRALTIIMLVHTVPSASIDAQRPLLRRSAGVYSRHPAAAASASLPKQRSMRNSCTYPCVI